jgi:hypothetical protein
MAYNKPELDHALKQDLGYDYIEIEFILEEKTTSPKVEEKAKEKYVLGPVISRKELRNDRKKRQKSFIDFENSSHSNVFAPAERRISY